jgi:hypothetical protein
MEKEREREKDREREREREKERKRDRENEKERERVKMKKKKKRGQQVLRHTIKQLNRGELFVGFDDLPGFFLPLPHLKRGHLLYFIASQKKDIKVVFIHADPKTGICLHMSLCTCTNDNSKQCMYAGVGTYSRLWAVTYVGDQIGRIFAFCVIVYIGQLFVSDIIT